MIAELSHYDIGVIKKTMIFFLKENKNDRLKEVKIKLANFM